MTETLQPGSQFGSYTLEVRLGGGGFGSVWRAKDNTSGETVALKILVGKFSSGDVGRIRSEVELLAAAASADSPNVVRVLGGGTEPSAHVVMEFIEGHDLEHELDQRTKLPQDETLLIVKAVAEALAVLEKAGIIHRDVKPANVMLADDGTIKLTDFGIAKIAGYESVTATGQLPLSAAYAAPEVWGGEATYQSDFYALGAVAFQCLTGSRPFAGTFVQLYEYHKTRPPDWALLPGDTVPALRQLMVACLAKEPAERPLNSASVLALVGEAETELARRAPEVGQPVTGHEPRALGPWLIKSKHESQPWTFRCLHETSGEHATVEVHFSDSLELGEQIKRAVLANPTLVPLGAERLLGTNRLILRPGETWPDRPPGQFMFWVARQELPAPVPPATVGDPLAEQYAGSALKLVAAVEAAGLVFDLGSDRAVLGLDGEVYATRVALPGGEQGPIVAWLRAVLPTSTLFEGLENDSELANFLAERERRREVAAPGVARVAGPTVASEIADESTLLDRSELGSATVAESEADPDPERNLSAPEQPTPIGPPPRSGAPRKWFGWGAGGVVVSAFIAAVVIFAFGGGDDSPVDCDGEACPTATASASAKSTASATELPTNAATTSPTFMPSPTGQSTIAPTTISTVTSVPPLVPTPTVTPAARAGPRVTISSSSIQNTDRKDGVRSFDVTITLYNSGDQQAVANMYGVGRFTLGNSFELPTIGAGDNAVHNKLGSLELSPGQEVVHNFTTGGLGVSASNLVLKLYLFPLGVGDRGDFSPGYPQIQADGIPGSIIAIPLPAASGTPPNRPLELTAILQFCGGCAQTYKNMSLVVSWIDGSQNEDSFWLSANPPGWGGGVVVSKNQTQYSEPICNHPLSDASLYTTGWPIVVFVQAINQYGHNDTPALTVNVPGGLGTC